MWNQNYYITKIRNSSSLGIKLRSCEVTLFLDKFVIHEVFQYFCLYEFEVYFNLFESISQF